MRIAFSGTANVGKTTLLKAFLNRWSMYTTPTKTYRDIIKEHGLKHSSAGSEETQLVILDWMMVEQKKYTKDSKIIYDRCPWDNLAYTLQGNAAGQISDEVTAAIISFVRESMKDLDIIFWLKYNPAIKVVNDGFREADIDYIKQTDQIFKDLFHQYMENLESDVFYPKEDCPAIIAIDDNFSTVDDRLMFIGEFLDYKGDLIETESSILDPSNEKVLGDMLKEQTMEKENEDRLKKLIEEFKK